MPKNLTNIIITVDVEIGDQALTHYKNDDAFDRFILGKCNFEYGIKFVMSSLEKFNFYGDFFFDLYPAQKYDTIKFRDLANEIIGRNHGLHLHTHPYSILGKYYLYQLSSKEQDDLISFGVSTLKNWTTQIPLAHRAGSYSANNQTLLSLKKHGIQYDSSYYHQYHNCHLQLDTINIPIIDPISKITEIPITVFYNNKKFLWLKRSHLIKIDIQHIASATKIYKIIESYYNKDVIILFLHSSSFLNVDFDYSTNNYRTFSVNHGLINEFLKLLDMFNKSANYKVTKINALNFHNLNVSLPKITGIL